MGQIVFNGQKPKYCNLIAIQTGGEHYNDSVALNEIWLVDTTNSSKNSSGTGKYDAYIVGDGTSSAGQLAVTDLRYIDTPIDMSEYSSTEEMMAAISGEINKISIPTSLSQLEDDENHRTVTDENIRNWNNAAAGEGGTLIGSSEDITLVNDTEQNINRLELADKIFNVQNYSGYGIKYIRADIEDTPVNNWETVDTATYYTNKHYVDLSGTIGDTVGNISGERNYTGHYKIPVVTGDVFKVKANIVDAVYNVPDWTNRAWAIARKDTGEIVDCYKSDNANFDRNQRVESFDIKVGDFGDEEYFLWINVIPYGKGHLVKKLNTSVESRSMRYLSPDFFDAENTIYVIKNDFDCNHYPINMPKNSVLLFNGGNIRNAEITGNNTTIIANKELPIFDSGVNLSGSWSNVKWYPKWFGVIADGVIDDTNALQKMLDLAENINKSIELIWYGYSFKTTKGLFIKNNTSIKGGTIIAKFNDPLDWVLQTYSYYPAAGKVYGYKVLVAWQDADNGKVYHTEGGIIEDLTIEGQLNEHYTEVVENEGEENEETVLVNDGTYAPIFGGLRIMASMTINTRNVTINNVGTGMARAACLNTCDDGLNIHACYRAFVGYAINGHSIRDSYLNAFCHYQKSSESDTRQVIPYHLEYQGAMPATLEYYVTYIEGTGGIDDSDAEKQRPKFCNVKLSYAYSIVFDNVLIDRYGEVAFATYYSGVTIRHPWFEEVYKCLLHTVNSRVTIETPYLPPSDTVDYDLISLTSKINLINCDGKITCKGGTSGTKHKYIFYQDTTKVSVMNAKTNDYPDDDSFSFLSGGSQGIDIVSATGATLEANTGRYYKYSTPITDLSVTLPAMPTVNSLKVICLNFTTGDTFNLAFTSADNKPIAYYSNYDVSGLNSEYEINCLYNGTKWVIAAAAVD